MRVGTFLAVAWVAAEGAGRAAGCPICSSGTGEQVRAGLVDGNLGVSVLATVLPFVTLAAVVAGIHFAGGKARPARGSGERAGVEERGAS